MYHAFPRPFHLLFTITILENEQPTPHSLQTWNLQDETQYSFLLA